MFTIREQQLTRLIAPLTPFYGSTTEWIELEHGELTTFSDIYRSQPAVRSVVDFIAGHCARMPLKLYKREPKGREHLQAHPMQKLLNVPNGHKRVGRMNFWRDTWLDFLIYDRLCLVKIANLETGDPCALVRIPPVWWTPWGQNYWWPEEIRIIGNRGFGGFPIEQCIYIHGYDPVDPRIGVSPMSTLRGILEEEAASTTWRKRLWEQGIQQSLIITRPEDAPQWNDEARDRFIESIRAAQNRGKPLLLEEGMSSNPASGFNPKSAEYITSKKFTRAEVLREYNMPEGLFEMTSGGSTAQDRAMLYSEVLSPYLLRFCDELETQLLTEWVDDPYDEDIYLEPAIEEKMRGNLVEQIDTMFKATGAPFYTRKEARDFMNMPELPDDDTLDTLIIPAGVTLSGAPEPPAPLALPPGAQGMPGQMGGQDSAPKEPANQNGPAKPPTSNEADSQTGDKPTDEHRTGGKVRAGARMKAVRSPKHAKARAGFSKKYQTVLKHYFARQRAVILSQKGAKAKVRFDKKRWNKELKDDLLPVTLATATYFGTKQADDIGGEYDEKRTEAYLDEMVGYSAENINESTLNDMIEMQDSEEATAEGGAGLGVLLAGMFAMYLGSRTDELADSTTTFAENFGLTEAVQQAAYAAGDEEGKGWTKTWHVTSDNPRPSHVALDGVTITSAAEFDNGCSYPGDPSGGPDETCKCECVLTYQRAEEEPATE